MLANKIDNILVNLQRYKGKEYVSKQELARILEVSMATVDKYLGCGELVVHHREKNKAMIPICEVDGFVEKLCNIEKQKAEKVKESFTLVEVRMDAVDIFEYYHIPVEQRAFYEKEISDTALLPADKRKQALVELAKRVRASLKSK